MVPDGKPLQEHPVNGAVPEGSTVTLFQLYFTNLLVVLICNITIYADNKCDWASNFEELPASELVSDLQDIVEVTF